MQAIKFVFVLYPCGNGVGWEKRAKPAFPYPHQDRGRWPLNPVPPIRDLRAARDLLADGKRMVAERRASKLLGELGG